MKFNVKNKANFDKEYGANQVFQFVFGEEHLKFLLAQNTLGKNKKKKGAVLHEPEVEYPNHIFITIRGRTNCELDVAV